VTIIGGKWKPVNVFLLRNDANRFNILQKAIPDFSKPMLINQLHELEGDGIIERTIFPEIPPRVEYNISERGQTLFPIIDAISELGLGRMGNTVCEQ